MKRPGSRVGDRPAEGWVDHSSLGATRSTHMLKKFIGALVLVLVGSIALADTVRGIINSVDDDKTITVTVRKKGEKKGEKKTYTLSKDTKYFVIKGKDDKEKSSLPKLKETLKDSKFVFGSLEVDGDKATEVGYGTFKKKPKKDKDLE
jgi:hypothetical protein